jgi:hypothetical protein
VAFEDNGAAPAAADATAAPPPAPTEAAPPADPGEAREAREAALDSDLRATWDKLHTPAAERGPDGRFAGKDKPAGELTPAQANKPDNKGQAPTEAKGQAQPATLPPPQSWPSEAKAKWEALPPEVRTTVDKRERESAAKISQMGNQVAAWRPVSETVERFRGDFERAGMDVPGGIEALLNANRMLNENPAAAIHKLAQTYGVDLTSLVTGQPRDAQTAALMAELQELRAQVAETSNRVGYRERAEAEAHMNDLIGRLDRFAEGKSDWDDLHDDVITNIQIIKRNNPALSADEVLQQAYDRAGWANPDVRARRLEAEQKAAAEKQQKEAIERAQKARNASAVNVRGDLVSGSNPKDWDSELSDIAAKHYGSSRR